MLSAKLFSLITFTITHCQANEAASRGQSRLRLENQNKLLCDSGCRLTQPTFVFKSLLPLTDLSFTSTSEHHNQPHSVHQYHLTSTFLIKQHHQQHPQWPARSRQLVSHHHFHRHRRLSSVALCDVVVSARHLRVAAWLHFIQPTTT